MPTDKTEKKQFLGSATVAVYFELGKDKFQPDTKFETKNKRLFNHLLKTGRIRL